MAILCPGVFPGLAHLDLGMTPHQRHLVVTWVKAAAAWAQVSLKSIRDMSKQKRMGTAHPPKTLTRTRSTWVQEVKSHPLLRGTSLKTWCLGWALEDIEVRTMRKKRCFGEVQRLDGYVVASRGLQGSYGLCEVSG